MESDRPMSDKNRFEFQGELSRIDTFTTNKGKQILTLVFELGGQFPQTVPIKVFGRLADRANEWKKGATVNVTGKLGGRSWNDKVYPDIVAESVEVMSGQQELPTGKPADEPAPDEDPGIPF